MKSPTEAEVASGGVKKPRQKKPLVETPSGDQNEFGWSFGRFRELIFCWTVPMSYYRDRLENSDSAASIKAAGILTITALILLINPLNEQISSKMAISGLLVLVISYSIRLFEKIFRRKLFSFHVVNIYACVSVILFFYYLLYSYGLFDSYYRGYDDDLAIVICGCDIEDAPIDLARRIIAILLSVGSCYLVWISKSIIWDASKPTLQDFLSSIYTLVGSSAVCWVVIYLTTPEMFDSIQEFMPILASN